MLRSPARELTMPSKKPADISDQLAKEDLLMMAQMAVTGGRYMLPRSLRGVKDLFRELYKLQAKASAILERHGYGVTAPTRELAETGNALVADIALRVETLKAEFQRRRCTPVAKERWLRDAYCRPVGVVHVEVIAPTPKKRKATR